MTDAMGPLGGGAQGVSPAQINALRARGVIS